MASIESNIRAHIDAVSTTAGEIDNILRAAFQDLSESAIGHITANWPVDTGRSIAAWTVSEVAPTHFTIYNSVDYSSWVHSQTAYGGPVPLWERLVLEIEAGFAEDTTQFLSDAVLALLVV